MTRTTISVTRSATIPGSMTEVWGLVGDFHRVAEWHPAVEESIRETVGHEEFRLLKLVGGGEILEHLVGKTTHSYTYTIIRSPLPVAHCEAKIEANTAGSATELTWGSSFTPLADNAEQAVAGVYESGFAALTERFSG